VNHIYLSRQDIFKIFVEYYYNNEIKRLQFDQEYAEIFRENFGMEVEGNDNDFYKEDKVQEVFEFVDRINYMLCWDMLKHQNLIFNQANTVKLIENNKNQLSKWI